LENAYIKPNYSLTYKAKHLGRNCQLSITSTDAPIIGRFADNRNRPITMPVSADCYLLCIMMALDTEIILF